MFNSWLFLSVLFLMCLRQVFWFLSQLLCFSFFKFRFAASCFSSVMFCHRLITGFLPQLLRYFSSTISLCDALLNAQNKKERFDFFFFFLCFKSDKRFLFYFTFWDFLLTNAWVFSLYFVFSPPFIEVCELKVKITMLFTVASYD